VFVLRPIPHHFALWLLLAPLLLLEIYTLDALTRVVALQNPANAQIVPARVIEQRDGPRGPEVRYAFRLPGRAEEFSARGALGRGSLWVPVTTDAFSGVERSGVIPVRYLPEDPWTNQPVGRLGYPVADSFCLWGLFLLLDLVWVGESALIVRNFLHTQVAVERRVSHRGRFWESRLLIDRRYAPFVAGEYGIPAAAPGGRKASRRK